MPQNKNAAPTGPHDKHLKRLIDSFSWAHFQVTGVWTSNKLIIEIGYHRNADSDWFGPITANWYRLAPTWI